MKKSVKMVTFPLEAKLFDKTDLLGFESEDFKRTFLNLPFQFCFGDHNFLE